MAMEPGASDAPTPPVAPGSAPWFRLPPITGTERRSQDDVPLSFKGLGGNRTSVLFNFPPSHASIVIQNEYEQLFRASQRMANIYVSEAAERPRVEAARRDIFMSYHQALDSLEFSLLDSYRARKLPAYPPPFFGCNPPVGSPQVDPEVQPTVAASEGVSSQS
ncbi:hypothetical protein GNI_084250 [Gregarina niphandrodes]|uniref:Uncharacterized protein n=1 Tax=Gregarina niphandrodes TaxID=110365 RepID=A0A023B6C3_GRENI|nr:hypothetical protein GNI_084250 [Gregarina niphandrodes]EZG65148.1 hypothetical protein GNI_084250 [Gregarina niphandrodes]|eukprot:XP_011134102.1 hypothetical protein GNI_084250 [Gregarina niphandrodes]